MKYKYKNLKHVVLHGMLPGEIKEFDHEILGGGIERIEQKPKMVKKQKEELIKESDSKEDN